jgi:hypothetical protein
MSESIWQRAWKDTEGFRQTTKSFLLVAVVGGAAFGVLGAMAGVWLTPTHATTFQQNLYAAVGAAAGVVLGWVLVFGLIYVWNLFRAPYRQSKDALRLARDIQQQYAAILDSVRFGLAFDNVTMDTGKSSEGVPFVIVGIKLQNTSKELIQHRLIKFEVILGGKTVDNPTFLNTSVYVLPGKTSQYYYPAIKGVDITKPIFGTLEYEIHYSSVPDKHWCMSRRKLAIDLLITDLATVQGRTGWRALEEESPIKEIPDKRIKTDGGKEYSYNDRPTIR